MTKKIQESYTDPKQFAMCNRMQALIDELLTGSPARENLARLCKREYKTHSYSSLGTLQELHDQYLKKYKKDYQPAKNFLRSGKL